MSTASGQAAEEVAANFLKKQGFRILARNWRNRWCEIDIVAVKGQRLYFIEVKYRSSNAWGDGLDYITPRKLQQMNFAAELWLLQQKLDQECCLAAINVSGTPPEVTDFIDSI